MNKHYKALELDKILQMLSEYTSCEDSKDLALMTEPCHGLFEVKSVLKETDDAYILTGRFGGPTFSGIKPVTNSLRRAEAGGSLSMLELLRIAEVLRVIRALKSWRSKSAGMETVLDLRFNALIPNKFLEERITSSIISEDEMSDSASPELAAIRRRIRAASGRARDHLEKIIRSSSYQKYLQDAIITIRGGRFVVPVKAECRGSVPGLVHDTSSSGATLFIEPMSVVEANNEIKELAVKETAEIERILASLSAEAGGFADSIIDAYNTIMELDVIFARAKLAYDMKASMPLMNSDGIISLNSARHPLIDKSSVVPTNITLGGAYDTLIITGPNTGGKTVALKTTGLLTLMAMCGLMIPAGDNSGLSVFDNILVDIGDEQSIEQSLSTFSAHMTNIIGILKTADSKSLVLLDELGAGTDPVEGAALAVSILESLRQKGAKIAATTHYAELKAFALQTEGIENGCCEFDVATLKPTYRLLIGIPGRSNAFAISRRLGIDESVVERAAELVAEDSRQFENVVESLLGTQQTLEKQVKEAGQMAREARLAKEKADAELNRIKMITEKEVESAKKEAKRITESARAHAALVMEQLEAVKKKQQLSSEDKAKLRAEIKLLEDELDPVNERQSNDNYVLPRPLEVGDSVLIVDIDKKGTVIKLPDSSGETLVLAGIIKTKVNTKNLRLLQKEKAKTVVGSSTRTVKSRADIRPVTEVDLRGMTADEAIFTLESAIDSAILSGIGQITVIHGKGTGVLRREVHSHLKNNKVIRTFRLGTFGEGESGVTIAELK